MKRTLTIALAAVMPLFLNAQNITVRVETDPMEKQIIAKELYGQFSEHLGSCIYGGLWVGPDSNIPNINGYRKDVFEALKELKVPVMRWPGGCFADDYHWRDGIGPQENRPHIVNNNWVAPWRTTRSVPTSSSTSVKCSAASHTSAEMSVPAPLRKCQSGLST